MRLIAALMLLSTPLFASFPSEIHSQVCYYMHRGQPDKAIARYLDYAKESGTSDLTLLQEGAALLLEEGMKSADPETALMTIFGAGVAMDPTLIPVFEKGLASKEPRIQLAALNCLAKLDDDMADDALFSALSSPFLLTRLEATFILAKKNDPTTIDHLETLFVKVPPMVRPLFPQIIAEINTPEASRFLRQLLGDDDLLVRIASVLASAESGKDDLLPQIRVLLSHPDPCMQEACLVAIAQFRDESSIKAAQECSKSSREMVRLAALDALVALGHKEASGEILEISKRGNLFALNSLPNGSQSTELLISLARSEDPSIRLNATLALLAQKNPAALQNIREILLTDDRDIGFNRQFSPGKGYSCWKVIPHATQKQKVFPAILGQTRGLREKVLQATLELPEEAFLSIATLLFSKGQLDLIPSLVELLANHKSEAAIKLLKEEQQHAGAPLIRNYCNLALYRLKEKGPYEENLLHWVQAEEKSSLIRFKESGEPVIGSTFSLTPEETSGLLIASFEALATAQNERGIEALLHAIAYGNPKNRYALAGLLMRTTE